MLNGDLEFEILEIFPLLLVYLFVKELKLKSILYTAFNDRGHRAISVHRTEYFSHTAGLTAASRMSHAR
jgi:hypothetical protein